MSFTYLVYGLKISSDINLQGLTTSNFSKPDLVLSTSNVPDWLDVAQRASERLVYASEGIAGGEPSFLLHSLGEEFFRLDYKDGATFIVDREGRRVWGQWYGSCTVEDFVTYLVGPILGFVLRQRGITCLHASAIAADGRAVALAGYRGAGKSTTAAAFAMRGYGVLCEDVAAIDAKGGHLVVHSGYPRICLWPNSVATLTGSADALPRLTPNWEKCFLSLEDRGAIFQRQSLRLGAIYVLARRLDAPHAPFVERLTPLEGFMELVQNTYMNFLLDREKRAREFVFLSQLVDAVRVRRVTPHADPARIEQLCDCILEDVANLTQTPARLRASAALGASKSTSA